MSTITAKKIAGAVTRASSEGNAPPQGFLTMVLGTSVINAIGDAEEAGELSAKAADKIRAKLRVFWKAIDKAEKKKANTRNYPVGLTITGISSQKWEDDDINDLGSLVVLELSDGSFLFPQQDEEGNGPGVLCGSHPKGKQTKYKGIQQHFQFSGGDKPGQVGCY